MLATAGVLAVPLSVSAQTLDRILAVVSGHVITASDVRAFLELGLSEVDGGKLDAERRVLDHLIDRRLVLDEADRLLVEGPPPARIEAALDEVATRFPDRGAFEGLLARTGLSLDDLRQILRDEARRASYLRDRFGAREPAEEDLRAYYEERAEEFREGGRRLPYDEAREAARQRMRARRDAAVEDWIAGLERRAPIARFDQQP
ncbi:MAG: hypothetical protein J4F37_04050 [Acidobacteria bacterium]|nr:hypothetical protein [Acidobacteriota bacterium]